MLYSQLIRVTELDNKIAGLHHSLQSLYAERAALTQWAQNANKSPEASKPLQTEPPSLTSGSLSDPQASYDALTNNWQARYSLKLPTFQTMRRKFEKACQVINLLVEDNPQLNGQVILVAVPPFRTLKTILADLDDEKRSHFAHLTPQLVTSAVRTKGWSLLVVTDTSFGAPVHGLQAFLSTKGYMHKEYDCGGLGIQELLAAELQGVSTLVEKDWTLLLKEHQEGKPVLCAKYHDNQIIFDVDDADCLLGANYLQPAIKIA